ncbi:MAG TPA: radical SAM protein [Elusimicrobiota bacterium]|nr:radical SAM protein [Elusimicrobiota bacterium]
MKISISYPPLASSKGVPLLSQNRQFQWFKSPTYIYPVIPAYAATLLKSRGFDVVWDDGIAEELTGEAWFQRLQRTDPNVIVLESKTPVIKLHWRLIEKIKGWKPAVKVVLVGDHVTALPQESMEKSAADYVITGGDHDFVLADLCAHLAGKTPALPGGVWYRGNGAVLNTGLADLNHDLNALPFIDRRLTRWDLYAHKNGNFKYTPGTYTMAGRDCWWGRCTFCSWTTLYPGKTFRTVSPERHVEEIGRLIADLNVREIFDDSGCFPKGEWLEKFCHGILQKGYNKRVTLGCNMRVGALRQEHWQLMKKAGFRFILIGLESVVQSTLDRLDKGIRVAQIEETVRMAKEAGLEPHITTMVGYPWETKEQSEQTIDFAKRLFRKGYLDTLQATIVVPYPGTPLFEESRKNGWLLTEDWDHYDMKQSVWKSPISNEDVLKLTQGLYKAALNPAFILRKILSIRNADDLKYLAHAGKKLIAHLMDFHGRSPKADDCSSPDDK